MIFLMMNILFFPFDPPGVSLSFTVTGQIIPAKILIVKNSLRYLWVFIFQGWGERTSGTD